MTLHADVRVRAGAFVLEAGIRAEPGEVLAILGPNGSGKSTLLAAIAGQRPATGSIRLGDRELLGPGRAVPAERRRVGLLGQQALLFPHLSALENVAFGPRAQGTPRARSRAEARRWLDEVGMAGYASRRPAQLSGGQQQRVALARALAARPGALLLDEPFSGLDAQTAGQARRLVADQRDRSGVPLVLVTHDPMDAVVLAARTVVLQEGRIVQQGATAEVLGHPGSAFVAAVAGVNLVTGVGAGGGVLARGTDGAPIMLSDGRSVIDGAPASAVFAPSAVRVRAGGDAAEEARPNAWAGTAALLEPVPGGVRIRTAEHPDIAVDCPAPAAATLGLRPGLRLGFTIAETDVSVRSSA